jgi:predicted RNA binding protein with dsRBD fold (UPF0201 family)
MKFKIIVQVRVSEDPSKVKLACETLFPEFRFRNAENEISGEGTEIPFTFQRAIEERRIRNTVEGILLGNLSNRKTHIELNKQAALNGIANVAEESTLLGSITLTIDDCDEQSIREFVWQK